LSTLEARLGLGLLFDQTAAPNTTATVVLEFFILDSFIKVRFVLMKIIVNTKIPVSINIEFTKALKHINFSTLNIFCQTKIIKKT
jgi:hypothetical protein